ncbi:MAG TPA: PEP-CTERM sorting domain-containing protein [Tepidisphaeraceae bacterium]|nr:PEP-CTERM sorting domain-containing protein [Tepidisphaeraceae bacterium]
MPNVTYLRAAVAAGLTVFLAAVPSTAPAAVVAQYAFTGGSAASTDPEPDASSTASNIALVATGSSISATSNNLFLRSNATTATTEAQAITNNTYVGFTFTPQNGVAYDLTALAFSSGASNSPTDQGSINASVAVKSSVGGFGEADPTLGTFTKTVAGGNGGSGVLDPRSIDLTTFGDAFQGLAGPVEFRFYIFDDKDSNDQINRLDSIVLSGDPVPEPATAGLLALGAVIGLARRRR